VKRTKQLQRVQHGRGGGRAHLQIFQVTQQVHKRRAGEQRLQSGVYVTPVAHVFQAAQLEHWSTVLQLVASQRFLEECSIFKTNKSF